MPARPYHAQPVLCITVDDTIRLCHGYLHRIRSVELSGRAEIAISVVLIAQFSLPGLSDFRPTAQFGTLCARSVRRSAVRMLLMPALLGLRLPRTQTATAPSV